MRSPAADRLAGWLAGWLSNLCHSASLFPYCVSGSLPLPSVDPTRYLWVHTHTHTHHPYRTVPNTNISCSSPVLLLTAWPRPHGPFADKNGVPAETPGEDPARRHERKKEHQFKADVGGEWGGRHGHRHCLLAGGRVRHRNSGRRQPCPAGARASSPPACAPWSCLIGFYLQYHMLVCVHARQKERDRRGLRGSWGPAHRGPRPPSRSAS